MCDRESSRNTEKEKGGLGAVFLAENEDKFVVTAEFRNVKKIK